MKTQFCCIALLITGLLGSAVSADTITYDGDVTPDVIFGDGNANGAWTIVTGGGVELGLRAKLRFDASNQPQNQFNSNGDGSYTFQAGQPVGGGFGFAPNSPSTAVWNFEWSINTDVDGTSGRNLDDLTYQMDIDFDPGAGTNFLSFDPIIIADPDFADHAIGNNLTGNGDGTAATSRSEYVSLIANNNVAQNSWNMEFFDGGPFVFDANVVGTYTFRLTAFDSVGQVASTEMIVNSVPEPASLSVMAIGGLAMLSFRRRRSTNL